MIYIYDIILNFNKDFIDFYEWNKSDILTHIKKIPIFKIENNKNIITDLVKFNNINDFLQNIENETEIYSKKRCDNLKYSFLLCTKEKVIAFIINKKGNILKKSDLIIPEEDEILENFDHYNILPCNLEFKSTYDNNNEIQFLTRKEIQLIEKVKVKIKKCDDRFLKYLYLEMYSQKNINYKEILLNEKNINKIEIMNNFISFTQNKK